MIDIDSIKFSYENGDLVFDDFSLSIKEGEFLCVIGKSGCGKSTLLKLLAGLEFPQAGSIKVGDKPIEGPSIDRTIVFQSYSLFPWMTVEGNIKFALERAKKFTKDQIRERTDFYLEKVGLTDSKKKYPFQLSGGMRQRTAIARSFALDSQILLLDEPFGALDIKIRKELQDLVYEIWKENPEKTIILITHDLREAIDIASRIVFMKDGIIQKDIAISEAERTDFNKASTGQDKIDLLLELEALYE